MANLVPFATLIQITAASGNLKIESRIGGGGICLWLSVVERHGFEVFDCRVVLRPSGALVFSFECGVAALYASAARPAHAGPQPDPATDPHRTDGPERFFDIVATPNDL